MEDSSSAQVVAYMVWRETDDPLLYTEQAAARRQAVALHGDASLVEPLVRLEDVEHLQRMVDAYAAVHQEFRLLLAARGISPDAINAAQIDAVARLKPKSWSR